MRSFLIATALLCAGCSALSADEGGDFTNSVGMEMVRVEAGSFRMGSRHGDGDETPVHKVTISNPFHMSATEVTNAQYEQFDSDHEELRGKLGFSRADDEAVVFVSWHDAVAFCEWLSEKEGKPYRLPTEGEWEYACRAGTTTPYSTGEELPAPFRKNVKNSWYPARGGRDEVVSLHVGKTPPNPWGLHDMHGNVEEWCLDWYGSYAAGPQIDPVGRADGDFRVTRGGSHSTTLRYLRSANRMGTLPKDKHWLIGFRVVCGEMPDSEPLPSSPKEKWARNVSQEKADWSGGPDMSEPYFESPTTYVKIPAGADGPLYARHNHCPALVACPNGDMLAIWYTCRREPGRELGIAASRLRRGSEEWQPAAPFWNAPDRNDHASALFLDEDGTIFHFNGLGAAGTWGGLATIMRTSDDNGATWSRAKLIMPEHGVHHMPIETVFKTQEGYLIVPCDAVPGGEGGSTVLVSRDGGKTWNDPAADRAPAEFKAGNTGPLIAGIHAGVLQLEDGRLMALGRGNNIDGHMPMSISDDMGQHWTYSASPFPPIGGGQRLVLTRLNEGPLFFASFGNITFTDSAGNAHKGSGLFAALSYDEGESWEIRRLITPGGPPRRVDGGGNTGIFTMSYSSAEPRGYLSVHQTPDDVIHLISSKQYYAFNLAWLETDPAPPPPPPDPTELEVKPELERVFRADTLPTEAGWRFNGTNAEEPEAVQITDGSLGIDTGSGQRVRWVGEPPHHFEHAASDRGHTLQITMKVTRSTAPSRGIDLESYVPGAGRAFITVTPSAVFYHSGRFTQLAGDLDNSSGMHSYRLSVLPDGTVHVFRDGEHLGAERTLSRPDRMAGADGAYIQWGEGAGGSESDAVVSSLTYDTTGAYRPEAN